MYLYSANGNKWNIGASSYFIDYKTKNGTKFSIAIRCQLGGSQNDEVALVDTGAAFTKISEETADIIKNKLDPTNETRDILTMWGYRKCSMFIMPLYIKADHGEDLSLDVLTCVVPNWPEQTIIGMRGGLEKIRCAFDPGTNDDGIFYFGSAG